MVRPPREAATGSRSRRILDSTSWNPAETPPSLLSRPAINALFFRGRPALVESAPVAFVDFHCPGQQIPSRPHHRAPHFVQPRPSRFVPVEAQHSGLQSQSAGSGLSGGDPPQARNHVGKGCACPERWSPRSPRFGHPHAAHCSSTFGQRPTTFHNRNPDSEKPSIGSAQPERMAVAGLRTATRRVRTLSGSEDNLPKLQAYYILGLPESTGYPSSGIRYLIDWMHIL